MSGVAVIYHLLSNDASLTAVVPAAKIKAGVVPVNTELPAISIRQISGTELSVIKRGLNQQVTERIQVTVNASTYTQQKEIIELTRDALPGTHGTVNSISVLSLTYESDGPDLEYENPQIFEQSMDYFVTYAR